MKILKPLLVFIVIVLIGVGVGWLASRRGSLPAPTPATGGSSTAAQNPDTTPAAQPAALKMGVQSQNTNEVIIPTETAESEMATNPDDQISDIIGADEEVTNIVKNLVALYPKLSDDGKLEAAEHLTNLVPDDDYGPLANILTNGTVTGPVASHLLGDLIERPNEIKMPLMLAVARDASNPGAKEALDNLQLLVDPEEDPGTDWDKWQKAIDSWMKDNPD